MRILLFLYFFILFINNTKAISTADSTLYDSLQLSTDIKLNNSRAFKTYHSDDSWFRSGYNNSISSVIGRTGIMSSNNYTSNFIAPSYSYRGNTESIIILNGTPLNIYDIKSTGNTTNTQIAYISPLEINNMSVLKGGKLTSIYGGYGSSGGTFLNSNSLNSKGWNVSFQSSYSNIKDRNGSSNISYLKEGFAVGYGNKKIYSRFVVEYLYGNTKSQLDSKQNGYYLSNSSLFQISKKIKVKSYLNKYYQSTSADITSYENDRIIGGLSVNYDLLEYLTLSAGASLLEINQTEVLAAHSTPILSIPEQKNIQIWNQKYYYLQTHIDKIINETLGINAKFGIRKLKKTKSFEHKINSLNIINVALNKNDLDYSYGDITLDYKKIFYMGYSINKEKNSLYPSDDDITLYKNMYSSFIFSELINKSIFYNGLIRMNHTSIGDNIRIYEIGSEVSFLDNKLNGSFTYYNYEQKSSPTAFKSTSGFVSLDNNIGLITKSAFEIEINAKVKSFWSISFSWANFKSDVESNNNSIGLINNDFNNLSNGIISGRSFGSISGTSSFNSNVLGNLNPKWNTNLYNDFSFKNINTGLLLSYRKGGDVLSYGNQGTIIEDGSGLVLRNIYISYNLQDMWFVKNGQLGLSAQNIFSKTKLSDNYIPSDIGISDVFSSNSKSININLKLDF